MRAVLPALLLVALLPAAAHADPAPPRRHWYGGKPLAVDAGALGAASLALVAAANHHGNLADGLLLAGTGLYVVGAPVVEGHGGRTRHAIASALLRIGVPAVGAVAYATLTPSGPSDEPRTGRLIIGATVAAMTTMVFDDAILCNEKTPYVAPVPGGVTAGIAGGF